MKLSQTTSDRFWSKVNVNADTSQCWLWRGAKTGNGYGNFSVQEISSKVPAHRVSYWLQSGEYPGDRMVVRHKCDTPLCVNPHHLEIGTQSDNMTDMVSRGRRNYARQVR